MTRFRRAARGAMLAALLLAPAAAAAQGSPIGLRGYAVFDRTEMTARDTFQGVLGKSRLPAEGMGGEVIRLWGGLFARVAATTLEEQGTRVVVSGSEAIALDIPLTVKIRHLEFGGGWRFGDALGKRLVGYAGGSLLRLTYRETSAFAEASEDDEEMFTGYAAFAGADLSIWKWIMAGAEIQYRTVPDAIGQAGASQAFGETDLGGVTLRVLVGIRR